jgi:hypothetical protein
MDKEIEKKRFEVRYRVHPDGWQEKAVFIDGEKLDYSIDISEYREAVSMGPHMKLAVQKDIERHFTECVSEVLGRYVTLDDIKEAITTGWI